MSRFPKADLEALKARVDLVAVVGAVAPLEKRGDDLVCRCPLPGHEDRTASFHVTPSTKLWHCFGCGRGGDVIEFVMAHSGVSFREAVAQLQGAPLSSTPQAPTSTKLSPAPLSAEQLDTLARVAGFYASTLTESPEALAYLEKRGIAVDAAAHFGIGYSNRTLCTDLAARNTAKGRAQREKLMDVGVLRERTGHEHFRGCIVVPLHDENGRVVGMYGRRLNDESDSPSHLYLDGPHRGVFNEQGFSSTGEVILCEAIVDALTFWSAGFRNVTSSFGADGFNSELLAALKRAAVKTVLVAYDNDEGGNIGAAKVTQLLKREGFTVGRVVFPRGMDANEYALRVTPAAKALAVVVERAREDVRSREALVVAARAPEVTSFAPATIEAIPAAQPSTSTTPAPTTETEPQPLPLAASAVAAEPSTSTKPASDELIIEMEDRRYRVRGLLSNTAPTVLKVNLMVHRGRAFFVDTVDVYQQSQRVKFMVAAARELGVDDGAIKRDLSALLLRLEHAQQEMLAALLMSKKKEAPPLSEDEEREALALLRRPDLVDEILRDFERCGVVGESDNKLLGYLAMTSRKTSTPLAVMVQSSSAAGKSSLMDAVLAFCPDEDKTQFSAMTQQSLFYMGQAELKHQVLAIAEEEGAKNAALPLKLMQSAGEVTIAAPGKDPNTGRLQTTPYKVEGPVMLFLTTTSIEVDEELMNRCLVLSVDENREQTKAIHQMQRERRTLEGRVLGHKRADVLKRQQNAQRLLRPVEVVNPYAKQLTFVDDKTRTRRDHMKYLLLIEAVAFVHQHQRPLKRVEQDGKAFEYIEVTLDDIRLANRLAHVALGRSLDELPPHTRKLLVQLDAHVRTLCAEKELARSDVRLTRREILDVTGLSLTQLRVHLQRLVDLEHVLVHAGKRGLSFVYEVVFDGNGDDGRPHLSGLLDVDTLQRELQHEPPCDPPRDDCPAVGGGMAGPKRPQSGGPPAKLVVVEKPAEIVPVGGGFAGAHEGGAGPAVVRTSSTVSAQDAL